MDKKSLTQLLMEDKLGAFLETSHKMLDQFIAFKGIDHQQDLILLSNNFHSLERDYKNATITSEAYDSKKNKLIIRFLNLIESFDESDFFDILADQGTEILEQQAKNASPSLYRGLQIKEGIEKNRIYNLDALFVSKPLLKGGRLTETTLSINDINILELAPHFISKKHFTLEKIMDNEHRPELKIYDGQLLIPSNRNSRVPSRNGLLINGISATEAKLQAGDLISIGHTIIEIISL